ncbi:MAG: histidine--tRNA ligase [Promethearchaeota archaeon]
MPTKKLDLTRPTGTRDFLPDEMRTFRYFESVVRETIESHGFEEVQTPTFEFFDLFLIRSGEKFREDSFTFKAPKFEVLDGKDASNGEGETEKVFVLRPEFTAPICRFYITSEISRYPKPVRMYYMGPVYRYDKPAPGRYREFFQAGVEIFGSGSAISDAEIILLAMRVVKKLGIHDAFLRISDLNIIRCLLADFGVTDDIQNKIIALVDKASGDIIKGGDILTEFSREEIITEFVNSCDEIGVSQDLADVLMGLINLMKGDFESVKSAALPMLGSYERAANALETTTLPVIEKILKMNDIESFCIDFSLARGLDYYTGMIFEIESPSLGKQKQICGGGRYDRLIEEFGGPPTPAVGFAFGLDRLILAANANGHDAFTRKKARAKVFLFAFNKDLMPDLFKIQEKLINEDIPAEINVVHEKIKKALAFASKLGFQYAILLGDKEKQENKVTIKNLGTGEQSTLTIEDAIAMIKNEN